MCGSRDSLKTAPGASRDVLEGMCDRLAHRGPDAYGWMADEHVALGHRRLSIIDLSSGDQPMGNEDGAIQVVFNGEIYNYRELRAELQAKGHRFRSGSDTEVLVHLYEEAGERTPEFLNGMFAFAIWDARRRRLFLARDRMGKKPLYYSAEVPGFRFAFASELKALTALPGFQAREDARGDGRFSGALLVPDPRTIYRGVWKLEPAHSLWWTALGMRQRRYWKPEFRQAAARGKTPWRAGRAGRDAVGEAHDQRRSAGCVPERRRGFERGGGLHGAQGATAVRTFSIGFTNKRFDELEYARAVAGRYRHRASRAIVTPRIEDVLDTLARHMDEPFGDSSIVPMLYLAQMTRRHVTVALSGDGADEVFGGYRRYYFGVLEEKLRRKFPARSAGR